MVDHTANIQAENEPHFRGASSHFYYQRFCSKPNVNSRKVWSGASRASCFLYEVTFSQYTVIDDRVDIEMRDGGGIPAKTIRT